MQIVMISIAIYAFKNGDPKRLAIPYDPDHKPCGIEDYQDYPFIYFVSPTMDTLYRTTCVSECPKTDQDTLKCKTNSEVPSCSPNASTDPKVAILIRPSVPF